MERDKSWELISNIGIKIKKSWKILANAHKLKIKIQGLNAIPNFFFFSKNNNLYKTYISQEMLKKGFLASNIVFTCIDHNEKILIKYFDNMEKIFKKIKDCENEREDIQNILEVPPSLEGFRSNNLNTIKFK